VLLEDGHGNWEVLLDDPLDECLMSVLGLAIVGECVFQRLTSSLHRGFSHLNGFVEDTVIFERIMFVDKRRWDSTSI
jgi:hypothetical protein